MPTETPDLSPDSPPPGNIVDLTMPIDDAHFRWKVERRETHGFDRGDIFQSTWFSMPAHAFTHIDAPRHFVPDGHTTDGIELDRVVGDAAVADLSDLQPNEAVTAERIAKACSHVRERDIVILRSGWERHHAPDTESFWREAPYMTLEAAHWLLERKIRAIAYDFPQDYCIRLLLDGEARPVEENVTHHVLLRNGVIMMEYLCNTMALKSERTFLCALPLKIPNCDGAPARIIAIEP